MTKWEDKKDILIDLIQIQKIPYEQIGKIYNCSGNNIKKVAKKLGIELSPRRKINENETFNRGKGNKGVCINCGKTYNIYRQSNNKYCSYKCREEYKHKLYIEQWKNGCESGLKGKYDVSVHIRKYLFEKYNCKCQECGWGEINPYTKRIPLQIHHKNGDCTNNSEENLQLLCPNCHALTENFGSRNNNATRKDNRKRY